MNKFLSSFLIPQKEKELKIILVIILFFSCFIVFKLLQKPTIYDATLKKITHTYVRDTAVKENIFKVDQPFYYRDTENTLRWDGMVYFKISDNYYNYDDSHYAFFPLFPLLWSILQVDGLYIGIINYLLFCFSILLLSNLFLNDKTTSLMDRLCVFGLSLLVPTMVVYYLPYAEALFTFTFGCAMWGLSKKKYWVFFISIVLFAMTRPVFAIAGLSFIIIDVLYFIKYRNFSHFLKDALLKLLPLILGTCIVFYMFYLNSGSFIKYFESTHDNWKIKFSIPTKITDWSIEGYAMNIFTLFFILFPSLILFFKKAITFLRSGKDEKPRSIFSGDINFIKEYFLNFSIVYFWGVFMFVLFYQNGSLNGLSRYIFCSPFFYIFLFCLLTDLKEIKINAFLLANFFLLLSSLFALTALKNMEPELNFNDSGFFVLFLDFVFLGTMRYMKKFIKVAALALLSVYNIVWMAYLYNIYLCDGWIFT